MAEMFGNRKPKIPVSKNDIKKATLAANRKLERKNKELEVNAKDAQKKVKEAEKAEKVLSKEVLGLQKQKDSAESNLQSLQLKVRKEESNLSDAIASRQHQEELEAESEVAYDNLVKTHDKISKAISIMEEKKSQSRSISRKLTEANEEYAVMVSDIERIEKAIKVLQNDIAGFEVDKLHAKTTFEALQDELKDKQSSIEGEIADINAQTEKAQDELYKVNTALNSAVANKNDEINILDSIITKKEQDYIDLETKCKIVNKSLERANKAVEDAVKREAASINSIKVNFKTWKIKALEEVARMKLKGRMEKIDKAGLKDILGE